MLPDVRAFTAAAGRPPGLGIVGDNPSSEIYVRNKVKAGAETGLWVDLQRLPATARLEELLALVERLNASDAHDGILVQAPLPEAMGKHAAQAVFDAIDPGKDVDGSIRPMSAGSSRAVRTWCCTPSGVIVMLEHYGIHDRAVARRRDRPQRDCRQTDGDAALARDATVTICHSKTPDLPAVAREADILVAAIGRAGFVTPSFVKPGATVIDVGINRVTDLATARRFSMRARTGSQISSDERSVVVGDMRRSPRLPGR